MAPKKKKPFRAVTAVKALSRKVIGTVPITRAVPKKKEKTDKHRPTMGKMLGEERRQRLDAGRLWPARRGNPMQARGAERPLRQHDLERSIFQRFTQNKIR